MQKSIILKRLLTASAVTVMLCAVGMQAQAKNSAQNGVIGQTGPSVKLSSGDEKALKDMAQANINEVAAAKIALSKAQNSQVKAFAQQMQKDHGEALTKVQAVAKQKGVTLPTEPDARHKAMAARLEKLSGSAFDKMYMEHAGTMDHKKVLSALQSDSRKIKDPDVKALADAHLPVVEQHLKSAQQISMQTGMPASK